MSKLGETASDIVEGLMAIAIVLVGTFVTSFVICFAVGLAIAESYVIDLKKRFRLVAKKSKPLEEAKTVG